MQTKQLDEHVGDAMENDLKQQYTIQLHLLHSVDITLFTNNSLT
jgi:hypothetical protein